MGGISNGRWNRPAPNPIEVGVLGDTFEVCTPKLSWILLNNLLGGNQCVYGLQYWSTLLKGMTHDLRIPVAWQAMRG